MLHAAVLSTSSDFPTYGDLSGWSTKGHFPCPACHKSLKNKEGYLGHLHWLPLNHKWRKDAKSFHNLKDKGTMPTPWIKDEVLTYYSQFT